MHTGKIKTSINAEEDLSNRRNMKYSNLVHKGKYPLPSTEVDKDDCTDFLGNFSQRESMAMQRKAVTFPDDKLPGKKLSTDDEPATKDKEIKYILPIMSEYVHVVEEINKVRQTRQTDRDLLNTEQKDLRKEYMEMEAACREIDDMKQDLQCQHKELEATKHLYLKEKENINAESSKLQYERKSFSMLCEDFENDVKKFQYRQEQLEDEWNKLEESEVDIQNALDSQRKRGIGVINLQQSIRLTEESVSIALANPGCAENMFMRPGQVRNNLSKVTILLMCLSGFCISGLTESLASLFVTVLILTAITLKVESI